MGVLVYLFDEPKIMEKRSSEARKRNHNFSCTHCTAQKRNLPSKEIGFAYIGELWEGAFGF